MTFFFKVRPPKPPVFTPIKEAKTVVEFRYTGDVWRPGEVIEMTTKRDKKRGRADRVNPTQKRLDSNQSKL